MYKLLKPLEGYIQVYVYIAAIVGLSASARC